jgi:surface antigen
MRTHALALAATAAALTATAPLPASAQGMGLNSLFSCQGSSGTTGTVVGGLTGALVGSQISKNERTLGAIVGAGLGAWAGNQVACRMNTSGRDRAENAFERALNTGRTQTWYDQRTGASGRIEVVDDRYASGYGAPYAGEYARTVSATDLRYARGVERVYRLTSAAPTYQATGRINVRAAPSTRAPVVDRLAPGETISAAGMTSDGWLVVEDNGWVRGYVAEAAVRPASGMTYARGPGRDCRLVEQTVSMRGYRTETQRFNACRDSRGEWRVNPV